MKDLGYEDNTSKPGKPGYAHSRGKGNGHANNKPRQDGKNTDRSVNAGDHLWKHENSEGEGEIYE